VRNKIIFALAILGIAAGLVSAYIQGIEKKPLPPVFTPAPNPYAKGVYANGIIESYQSTGENINIFPEVPGTVIQIAAVEGTTVRQGTPLLRLDDSTQRAATEQLKAQAEAALALLQELKAEPRKEVLEVSTAQVELAAANLKTSQDQLDKLKRSYELDPRSVSKEQLDNAEDAVKVARANLDVNTKQLELTKAGAWIYDIQDQQRQYEASSKAYASAKALLDKYTIRAPVDGVVLAVRTSVGSFVSSVGAYGTYTQGYNPVIVIGSPQAYLGVRCYIDEILVPRLPPASQMRATMFIRGTNTSIPLEFVRMQPYLIPKIELSDQRTERVDVRVLPIVFRFKTPQDLNVYPGQLVDVYVETK
jgi:HlyD family secretion protein